MTQKTGGLFNPSIFNVTLKSKEDSLIRLKFDLRLKDSSIMSGSSIYTVINNKSCE